MLQAGVNELVVQPNLTVVETGFRLYDEQGITVLVNALICEGEQTLPVVVSVHNYTIAITVPLIPKVHGIVLKRLVAVDNTFDEAVLRGQTVPLLLVKVSHRVFKARIDFGVKGVRPAQGKAVSTQNDPVVHGVEDALQDVIGFHFAIVHNSCVFLYYCNYRAKLYLA